MNQVVVEDQVSMTIDNDEISDATSEVDSSSNCFEFFITNGLAKIDESSFEDRIIRTSFFSGMGENSRMANKIKIVAIHKNLNSSWSGKARAQSFRILAKAVADKCGGGDANIKYAWYSAPVDEICEILMHGFSWYRKDAGGRDCSRRSISLSPAKYCFDSVLSSEVDETGLKHLLLCRVILGKQEVVTSDQIQPSSAEFDSGVDDLSSPRKYIIWSNYMNSHILPCYIVSFQGPYLRGSKRLLEANTIKPRSSWMGFPTLISMLSRDLDPSKTAALEKHYTYFREKKITRQQMIQTVKEIAGNQLLAAIFNVYTNKELQAGSSNKRAKAVMPAIVR